MNSLALFRLARLLPFLLLLHTATTNARTDVQVSEQSPPIGQVDFPVSCNEETRDSLERAVMMLHHMMYAQAEKEFRSIVASEPDCAMAHWGIAMALFHPLWPGEPTEAELQQGSQVLIRQRHCSLSLSGKTHISPLPDHITVTGVRRAIRNGSPHGRRLNILFIRVTVTIPTPLPFMHWPCWQLRPKGTSHIATRGRPEQSWRTFIPMNLSTRVSSTI